MEAVVPNRLEGEAGKTANSEKIGMHLSISGSLMACKWGYRRGGATAYEKGRSNRKLSAVWGI